MKKLLCCSLLALTMGLTHAPTAYAQEDGAQLIKPDDPIAKRDRDKEAEQRFGKSSGIYDAEKIPFENIRKALEENREDDPFLREYSISLAHINIDETTGEEVLAGNWPLNESETWGTFLDIVEDSRPISQRLAFSLDKEKTEKDFYVLSNHDKVTGSYMSLFIFENNIMQEQRLIFNIYYRDTIGIRDSMLSMAQKYNSEFVKPGNPFAEKGLEITVKGRTDKEFAKFLITDQADIEELRQRFIKLEEPIKYTDFLVKKAKVNLFKNIEYFKAYNSAKYENFPLEFSVTDGIIQITENEYRQKFTRDPEGLFGTIEEVANNLYSKADRAEEVTVITNQDQQTASDDPSSIESRIEITTEGQEVSQEEPQTGAQ